MLRKSPSITLVTNLQNKQISAYLKFIKTCVESGVTSIQLREKSLNQDELEAFGKQLKKLLDSLNIPLIVNDSLQTCLKINACGLHLGQTDGNINQARKILGPKKILGLSTNSLKEIKKANNLPVDYIGVGSIFNTKSKANVKKIWGISGLKEAYKLSKHPIIAIGGINQANITSIIKTGVKHIAAIEAFHNTHFPEKICQNLKKIINGDCLVMYENINKVIKILRRKNPVILSLTNLVTMDFVANSLLAAGAAPIMSQIKEELDELILISSAVYINIGTLDYSFLKRITTAVNLANRYKKPVILDPVGSGATKIRTSTARKLLENICIIRGNASEIISLTNNLTISKGVESVDTIAAAKPAAIKIAQDYDITVAISGETDFITNGQTNAKITHGSDIMPLITGMGCSLTAIIAAFRSIIENSFEATKLAIEYFTLCGSLAAQQTQALGSFKSIFIDHLRACDFENIK